MRNTIIRFFFALIHHPSEEITLPCRECWTREVEAAWQKARAREWTPGKVLTPDWAIDASTLESIPLHQKMSVDDWRRLAHAGEETRS